MAVYAATVSSKMRHATKLLQGGRMAIFAGTVTISNYNQTLVEITAITKKFKSVVAVISGASSAGNPMTWVNASGAFKAYVSSTGAEVANDVATVGTVNFVAIGMI